MENFLEKGFQFNKNYGQNFIFDTNFLRSIVSDSGIDKNTNVLEIGTGAGTLTKFIAEKAKNVVSYEIDNNLKSTIEVNLKNSPNVKVVFKDIMKVSIDEIENNFDGDYYLIANLPYYITTPIIFKFIEKANNLKTIIIMVQLEVANRICAKPNSVDYGAITPAIDYRGTAKIIKKVSRKMFVPVPNVDSAIVRIDLNKNKFQIKNENVLNTLIKSAFAMRRKTLINNIKKSFNLPNETIMGFLKQLNLNEKVRGESLSTIEFVDLSNLICEYLNI